VIGNRKQQWLRAGELRLELLGDQLPDGAAKKFEGFLLHQNDRFTQTTTIRAERYHGFETPSGGVAARTGVVGHNRRQRRCATLAAVIVTDE
jgi:hypothetical protein